MWFVLLAGENGEDGERKGYTAIEEKDRLS
jgi:hypothetical protein